MSSDSAIGSPYLGTAAEWPKHRKLLLDFCKKNPVLRFAPWYAFKEIVIPISTARGGTFSCSDLFTWLSAVLAGCCVTWTIAVGIHLWPSRVILNAGCCLCGRVQIPLLLAENLGQNRKNVNPCYSPRRCGCKASSVSQAVITWSLQAFFVTSSCFVAVLNVQCILDLVLVAFFQNSQL